MGLRDQRTVLSCLKITEVRRKRYDLHFLGKLTTTLCLFFALALNLHSQVTVSASLTDGTGALYRTAYLHFQLLNCGDNFPAVPSQPGMIVQDSFSVRECGVDLVSSHTHEGLEPSVTRWVAIWDLCQPHTQSELLSGNCGNLESTFGDADDHSAAGSRISGGVREPDPRPVHLPWRNLFGDSSRLLRHPP